MVKKSTPKKKIPTNAAPTKPKKKRVKKPTYKVVPIETTVAAAIGDAMSEFQSLGEEMRETADNMEGANMGHMQKCQDASEAADELENHTDEPDVPEFLQDLKVTTTELRNRNKRRGPSRAIRFSNAQSLIQAARDAVKEFADSEDPGRKEEEAEEADQLASDLDEHCEFDVNFPGMYG